jgi:chromate transporter
MLAVPLVIVLSLTAAYAEFSRVAMVSGALRGMGAVAAGLIISTAVKLMATLATNRLGRPLALAFVALTFIAIGVLRWPLIWVLAGLGSVAVAIAWMRWR